MKEIFIALAYTAGGIEGGIELVPNEDTSLIAALHPRWAESGVEMAQVNKRTWN